MIEPSLFLPGANIFPEEMWVVNWLRDMWQEETRGGTPIGVGCFSFKSPSPQPELHSPMGHRQLPSSAPLGLAAGDTQQSHDTNQLSTEPNARETQQDLEHVQDSQSHNAKLNEPWHSSSNVPLAELIGTSQALSEEAVVGVCGEGRDCQQDPSHVLNRPASQDDSSQVNSGSSEDDCGGLIFDSDPSAIQSFECGPSQDRAMGKRKAVHQLTPPSSNSRRYGADNWNSQLGPSFDKTLQVESAGASFSSGLSASGAMDEDLYEALLVLQQSFTTVLETLKTRLGSSEACRVFNRVVDLECGRNGLNLDKYDAVISSLKGELTRRPPLSEIPETPPPS